MDENTIAEVARVIINEGLLFNWKFYLLVAAVGFVYVAASGFLLPYFARRGEAFATKADFQAIISQLEETTKTVEKVKAEVQREDWNWRELQTLRRIKLEELVSTVGGGFEWLSALRSNNYFQGKTVLSPDPAARANMIAALYFPELRTPVHSFGMAFTASAQQIYRSSGELLPLRGNQPAFQAHIDHIGPEIERHSAAVLLAIDLVQTEAQKIMFQVTGIGAQNNDAARAPD